MSDSWRQLPLGEVATLQRGYDLPNRLRKPGTVPIVTSSGTEDTHSESRVAAPGVVTGRYGTIGQVFYIEKDFWPLNTTLYVKEFHGNLPQFIAYLLRTIDFDSHSGKSGVPGVNRNDLHQLVVSLPPLPEQRAIAAALGDVDALITGLDQLIAKKRDIKQATMQQLLRGNVRISGVGNAPSALKETEVGLIPEEWEAILLDHVAKRGSGHTPDKGHPEYWNGKIKWVSLKDSSALDKVYIFDTAAKITPVGIANSSAIEHPAGTVILSRDAGVGKSAVLGDVMAVSQHFMAWQCGSRLHNHYLYYWLQLAKPQFERIAMGNTIKTIGLPYFRQLQIPLPSYSEQRAIAAVLSDMDAEIDALDKRLEKTRALKQGMMQELLTGRIRLV